MFQFPGFPSYDYLIHRRIHGSSPWGFPHSEIHGSMLIYSSPWLIAVSHVLLRLLMPRHSPYALCNLNLLFSFLRWVSQYLFTDLVACFLPPFGGKIAVSYLFSWKDQFLSFSIAFSISVRLLYSVFNDHLHSLWLCWTCRDVLRFHLWNEVVKTSSKTRRQSSALSSGRSGWIRTIDLALIRRAL